MSVDKIECNGSHNNEDSDAMEGSDEELVRINVTLKIVSDIYACLIL